MSDQIIGRLLGSFQLLENAISNARETLTARPNVNVLVLERLDSYTTLLGKQRIVAADLKGAIEAGLWQEVSQKIAVINGLLEMIRNDAKEVLSSLAGDTSEAEVEEAPKYLC